ncbi:integrase [Rhodococcus tibetensis]|uniref:Integrase n=1 Tax=Rhodococcus tibetensis TaxID=2965064 RepID=A0ABT1QFE7_9NOCA|nr:integrase [Rhodococcus sp. FXJ9.536]MCQ4121014.1 integrase [Rhodococcus sp. FXJ9.536]
MVPVGGWGSAPDLTDEATARIADAVTSSRAPGTRRVYACDWRRFRSWCETRGHSALPAHPVTVAAYLVDAADTVDGEGERAYSPSTLSRWVSVIGHYHRTASLPNPAGETLVSSTLSGIRRNYAAAGDRPRTPRAPLLTSDIVTIVGSARQAVTGWATEVHERRDSALLLMGFAGAFRRSDLVGLNCGDVTLHRLDGVHVRLRRSKTDQEGLGVVRALPFTTSHDSCPPCAYFRWAQVVAAFDVAGRPGVIRLLCTARPFESHVCRGGLSRMRARAPASFADWCAACDHRAVPAHPSVLAQFLAEHPAADGTQRRRVTAINAVHTEAELPAPGRAELIRQLLNAARADRLARTRERVAQVVLRIPVIGWPGGLLAAATLCFSPWPARA